MVLKTKLSFGLGFLFAIILALVIFCSYYIGRLSKDSGAILKDNYDSIVFSKNMFHALDDMTLSIQNHIFNSKSKEFTGYYLQLFQSGKSEFEKNLSDENSNITEIHEKEYVDALDKDYAVYSNLCIQLMTGEKNDSLYFSEFIPSYEKVRQSVNNINDINMQAIVRKNFLTIGDSRDIINYMAVIGAFCVILAFCYFWYFPFYISNSVSYLSERMKSLLKDNGIALDINTNDEVYIILQAINLLKNKLDGKREEK